MSQLPFDGSSLYRILPPNDLYAPVTTFEPYTHPSWIGFYPSVKNPQEVPLDLTTKPRKPIRKNTRKRKNTVPVAPPPVLPKPKPPPVPPVPVWPLIDSFRNRSLPENGPMALLPTGSPTTVAHMLQLVQKITYTQKYCTQRVAEEKAKKRF
ncbi:unnamed protein product [Caenorhabditis nigoni]